METATSDSTARTGTLSAALRIFAGLVSWREPTAAELEIRCEKLASGKVAFGTLVETGASSGATRSPGVREPSERSRR
jgi:hypothetical protein